LALSAGRDCPATSPYESNLSRYSMTNTSDRPA
jgi:hypothetical protein